MALKSYSVAGIGPFRVQKRKGTRNMRIRISQDGNVTISIPYWLPFSSGVDFAKSHIQWIEKHRKPKKLLTEMSRVGMYHQIQFIEGKTLRVTLDSDLVIVSVPSNLSILDDNVQLAAIRGAKKALIDESAYLSEKLQEIANKYGFSFKSVSHKFMKSKWGSCSSHKIITLNYRLLDLPERLQEYVMVHELAHTIHMNHSSKFWDIVTEKIPDFKQRRADLKHFDLGW